MRTIEFNANAFHIKVSQLSRAVENLNTDHTVKTHLDETDVTSIRELGRAIDQWQQLLKRYESSLHTEISKLNNIGSEFEETDQKLAQSLTAHFGK